MGVGVGLGHLEHSVYNVYYIIIICVHVRTCVMYYIARVCVQTGACRRCWFSWPVVERGVRRVCARRGRAHVLDSLNTRSVAVGIGAILHGRLIVDSSTCTRPDSFRRSTCAQDDETVVFPPAFSDFQAYANGSFKIYYRRRRTVIIIVYVSTRPREHHRVLFGQGKLKF